MKLRWLLAIVMIPTSSIANAQNALVIEKIKELDARAPKPDDAAILAAVTKTAEAAATAQGQCQPKSVTIEEVTSITGARLILDGILNNGLRNGWSVYARHQGCPGTDVVRYAVIQLADSTLRALQVNQGRSYANLSIMRDTSPQAGIAAFAAIKKIEPACAGSDIKFGPTRIDSEDKDLGPDMFGVRYVGSWTEIWQFTSCGRTAEVPVIFRADGDGGAYSSIKGAGVVVLPKP